MHLTEKLEKDMIEYNCVKIYKKTLSREVEGLAH